jgi:hypothetical protein
MILSGRNQDPNCEGILVVAGCKVCAERGINCDAPRNVADKLLIAAAPELLSACKALESLCCEKAFSTTELGEVLKLACEAIAKAEGRT